MPERLGPERFKEIVESIQHLDEHDVQNVMSACAVEVLSHGRINSSPASGRVVVLSPIAITPAAHATAGQGLPDMHFKNRCDRRDHFLTAGKLFARTDIIGFYAIHRLPPS